MNKWPSLKQLRYLIKLHELRHFGDAAKACFVSQSTLSSGIQNLEELLECQLIERDNRHLVFSPMGEEVVIRSRELLARSQDLMEIARSQGEMMEGKLRLGCIPTIAPFLLGDLVQEVNRQYPKLDLLLREDTTDNLLSALRHGEIDVLILALPIDIHGMESQIVGRDPFKMVISSQQVNSISVPIHYDNLPDESVFLLEKVHCLTDHAVSACQLTTKDKINPFTATSLHTLVQMVANGLGTTFIPQMAIEHGLLDNQNLLVFDPPGTDAYREIGLVWRPTSNRTAQFKKIATLVEELL
ncbi:LysR substrate-binding domain-containing protein [Vibrio sp. SS-MA-C1-2]|uniref:hydrogen peroxide-inducible genes activator n=1 Tax=Vibrio sp. SS-MA-C1-2 TaxID=2908646 RepID=UPI001F39E784|nr:hydrogen peroxide-inducible genes activator [Vibrio sp. SS-MA-C1-2]UJF18982.1 LysR substrate-binding domain-containing protein [Vibrio sp. SS-MA-C1-2]